jgi:hypothetical protein
VDKSKVLNVEQRLRQLLDANGSDKGSSHKYSYLYAVIFSLIDFTKEVKILEVGLGTNNVDTPSNMGYSGNPGASLRAFRDFEETVNCLGLDIDQRVLFEEERISTAVVDQMRLDSWKEVPTKQLGGHFDLIIDDGLHSPTANLNTILATKDLIKEDGFIVVEDIAERSLDVWRILAEVGISGFEMRVIEFPGNYCAVIAKVGTIPKILF